MKITKKMFVSLPFVLMERESHKKMFVFRVEQSVGLLLTQKCFWFWGVRCVHCASAYTASCPWRSALMFKGSTLCYTLLILNDWFFCVPFMCFPFEHPNPDFFKICQIWMSYLQRVPSVNELFLIVGPRHYRYAYKVCHSRCALSITQLHIILFLFLVFTFLYVVQTKDSICSLKVSTYVLIISEVNREPVTYKKHALVDWLMRHGRGLS